MKILYTFKDWIIHTGVHTYTRIIEILWQNRSNYLKKSNNNQQINKQSNFVFFSLTPVISDLAFENNSIIIIFCLFGIKNGKLKKKRGRGEFLKCKYIRVAGLVLEQWAVKNNGTAIRGNNVSVLRIICMDWKLLLH